MKSPKAKAFDFAFHVSCFVQEEYQDQERFDRCAAEFISLMSVKETNQRKRFCAHGKPGQSLVKGFFERASCPREKRRTSMRSEEHTSELQSLMRISYAVFC